MRMKQRLKNILPTCIEKIIFNYMNRPVNNYFKTNYKKKALISYIVKPFRSNVNFVSHTNYSEVFLMAEVLKEMHYNVDIIDYRDESDLIYDQYDLIIGFGNAFKKSFSGLKKITRVLYATGTNQCFQNKAELQRIKKLHDRKGIWLKARRIINESWTDYSVISDATISTGNDFTVSTFDDLWKINIYKVPLPIDINYSYEGIHRNFQKCKYHFLWFGSTGLVHKGLDLCIEFFADNPHYTLHICGPKENDFFDLYQNELELENIIYHGRVDISSQKYLDIVEQCLFAIFPSCSEGGGGALLTVMSSGLIPIATKEASVDLDDKGYLIENATVRGVEKAINIAVSDSTSEHEKKSEKSGFFIKNNYTNETYKKNMKKYLEKIVEQKVINVI